MSQNNWENAKESWYNTLLDECRNSSVEGCFDKYLGVYPSDLFQCYNGMWGMHFIFSLKNTSFDQSEELLEILQYCGAKVSRNLEDVTPYSTIIVDHDEKVNFEGPAFKINYIKDCLQQCKLLDISSYRQNATEDVPLESSCMSVVYLRHLSWNDAFSRSNKDRNMNSSKITKAEPEGNGVICKQNSSKITKAEPEGNGVICKHPRLYSDLERCNILKYIVHHQEYSRVKGRKLWMVMERKKVCPGRTWQSMKEHFLKRIVLELHSYSFLTEEERDIFKSVI